METRQHRSATEAAVFTMMEEHTGGEGAEVTIKFVPFSSAVESAFWVRFCREKLETIRLEEAPIPLRLTYTVQRSDPVPRLQCHDHSLLLSSPDPTSSQDLSSQWKNNECVFVNGHMIGYNTLESLQKLDKNQCLHDYFVNQFFSTDDSTVLKSLTSAILISFADLKSHSVVYWFGIPALVPQHSWRGQVLRDPERTDAIHASVETLRRQRLQRHEEGFPPFFICCKTTCVPLSRESYANLLQTETLADLCFGFLDLVADGGEQATELAPPTDSSLMGWPLRNLVAYLSFHLDGLAGQRVTMVSYRPRVIRRLTVGDDITSEHPEGHQSVLFSMQLPTKEEYDASLSPLRYKVVGWELNARAKPGPRSVNLRPLLDPHHLAVQAADLNLKLMKWRMIPDLQVELLQSSKVLLLGAGTLGCNVARVLLGWGVRHFKIVDYGKVSYSNPVRQSLFTLSDCSADGGSGRAKSVAAAEALKTIAADVESAGIVLSIPMPGHNDSEDVIRTSVETLDALVQEADVVFLLTDTRESRWLPTAMAAAHNKLLINAALGLDSWLVLRHGAGPHVPLNTGGVRHGCYFCSDVVAPENSSRNRTLDQQCTVTRPGLALVASAMAVELMVAVLHHPLHLAAPAPVAASQHFSPTLSAPDASASTLGILPQQIRGSLVSYTMMTPSVPAFLHCTGCSRRIVDAYLNDKVGLVHNCCQSADGSYLEDVAGLAAYRIEAAEKLVDVEGWEDEE
jgi:ubiquitin-like modifier-activating enzyme ATG7